MTIISNILKVSHPIQKKNHNKVQSMLSENVFCKSYTVQWIEKYKENCLVSRYSMLIKLPIVKPESKTYCPHINIECK